MCRKLRMSLVVMGLIAAILILGCNRKDGGAVAVKTERQTGNKISFTDLSGRLITIDKVPEKIALANFIANYFMVGGGSESLDKLVGLPSDGWKEVRFGEYTVFTEAYPKLLDMAVIAGYHDNFMDNERILTLNPDVIIISPGQYTDNNSSMSMYERAGIPVVVLDYHSFTLENHTKSTEILGLLLGRSDFARELNDIYTSAVNDLQTKISALPDSAKHKKIYAELGNKGAGEYGYSYPNDRLWGSILYSLQADNIGSGLSTYGALDREFVVTSNPQAIIIAGSIWGSYKGDQLRMGFTVDEATSQARLRPFAKRPEWTNLDAVRNGETYGVDHGSLCMMSDYTFIQYVAKIVYPELFKDLDPLKNMYEFYAKYLPEVDVTGSYMIKLAQ